MGKASSAKKVARVARSSAATGGPKDRIKLGFPAVVVAVLIVGVLLVAWSRASRDIDTGPGADEVWAMPYAVYVCDGFVGGAGGTIETSPVNEAGPEGLATLGTWGPDAGYTFASGSITLPDGTVLTDGYDCGGTPGVVSVTSWVPGAADDRGLSRTSAFDLIRFGEDGERFTFAVVPDGTTVPPPAASPVSTVLAELGPAQAPAGGGTTPLDGSVTPPAGQSGDAPADTTATTAP